MHTFWVRANTVIFYALTVLFVLSVLSATTTYVHHPNPEISVLRLNKLKSLRPQPTRDGRVVDRAFLTFDLEADLTTVFNWNVKNVFVFLLAEYKSESNNLNQVVLWDRSGLSKDEAVISLKNESIKYALFDMYNELQGVDVSLKLVWDPMPNTGRMIMSSIGQIGQSLFTLPDHYTMKK